MTLVLVTPNQVRLRLQNPSLSDEACTAYVDSARAVVEAFTGTLEWVADDIVDMDGGKKTIVLPFEPVVSDSHPLTVWTVDNVGSATLLQPNQGWRRHGRRLVREYASTLGPGLTRITGLEHYGAYQHPGVWPQTVRVQYSHGYQSADDVPAVLKNIILDSAVILGTNPQGLRSRQVGGMTDVWASETISGSSGIYTSVQAKLKLAGFLQRPGVFVIEAE